MSSSFTWGMRWFIIVFAAFLILGVSIGYGTYLGNKQEQQTNMECIAAGKSYERVDDKSYKMVCK